jgi:hypothetical protein
MRPKSDTVDQKVARIASRQHGVVTRPELLAAGMSASGIRRRVAKGVLLTEHRGVYRVGHRAPSVKAQYLAAVRACGEHAVLSGRAAGYLHRILKGPPPPPGVAAPVRRQVRGAVTRRSRINRSEVTTIKGIPVTTVARTLVDLAGGLGLDDLARACHEAGVLHKTTPRQVEAVLARRPNAPGAGKLRAIMRGDVHVTLSKLERRFLSVLREARLPLPQTNKIAGGRRVDCRWPDHHLTAELDSYRFHNSRYSWEDGYRRERQARARGEEFRRYTWADVFEDPRYMLAQLRTLLACDS